MAEDRVDFVEVGPRDGFQNWPHPVTTEVKVGLVKRALQAGVPRVEATSMVHPRWVPQMADAEDVLAAMTDQEMAQIRVLVPNLKGLERAIGSRARNVLVNIGATDGFNQHNLNRTVQETLADISDVLGRAQAEGIKVDASISVSWGCPYEGRVAPERVMDLSSRLVEMGCSELSFGDTIGVATPTSVIELCTRAVERFPTTPLFMHLHDTRGMALANALVALECGVRGFEGSVGGIGGCPFAPNSTGNVCSEDLLALVQDLGYETGIDVDAMVEAARVMAADLVADLPGRLHRAGPAPWRRAAVPAGDA